MNDTPPDRLAEARMTFNLDGAPGLRRNEVKHYRCKVFKSGNSLALRLPAALGLEAGMAMELTEQPSGGYALTPCPAPKPRLDISGFWGKAKGLKVPERRDFDERPSTIAARQAALKAAGGT
jgi:antitoxin VapB